MKKLVVSIFILILLGSATITVTGNFQKNNEINPFDKKILPIPGDISDDFVGFSNNIKVKNEDIQQKIFTSPITDDIIDMIQEIDEEILMGYLVNLTNFGPRVTGTTACSDAGDYIYSEFDNMGYDVRYHLWSYSGYTDRNIEATFYGEDPTSDEIYIICGHYDSVPGSPGADDDGSGVVALLSAASIMKDYTFNHTIRFVAFSGEEQGLLGSHVYAEEAYNNNDNIVAVLNADMIGYAITEYDGNNIKVYEDDFSEWITDFMDDVSIQYSDLIGLEVIPSGWSWGSDHYSFWEHGFSATFSHEYKFNPYWHTENDTIDKMNMTYLIKTSRLLLASLAELAQYNLENSAPQIDSLKGIKKGKPGIEYEFTFNASDPDGDRLYYYIDWGDDQITEWEGPYYSGDEVIFAHTWMEKGTYIIKAKVKDTYNLESEWVDFSVSMSKNKVFKNQFILKLIQRLSNIYPLLRYIQVL